MVSNISFGWLDFPIPPRVEFEHPPLLLALCQIRFPPVLSIANQDWIAPFQEALRSEYPLGIFMQPNVKVEIQMGVESSISSSVGPTPWRFADLEDNWAVILTTDFVALETRDYRDFDDFLRRLAQVLHALIEHVHPAIAKRIGLRYINEMRPSHENWQTVIRPELLGALAVPQFAPRAVQSIHQFVLRDKDGVSINVNHGVLPTGTTVNPRPGEATPNGPFYVLDIDVYQEFGSPHTLPINVDLICQRIETYHDAISRLFRRWITEEYASTLGRRDDGTE